MSMHETSLFFRGKSDRNVMIAPLEGAKGAMRVVVYGNQGKRGMGSPSNTPLAPYFRDRLFLFLDTLHAILPGVCDGVLQSSD
jgi:hypothetical protein